MSSEVLTLVGVVVGALLAGAGQILANVLISRHQAKSAIRERQHDAYSQVLLQANLAASSAKSYDTEGPLEELIVPPTDVVENFRAVRKWRRMERNIKRAANEVNFESEEMWRLTAVLRLVAPVDTYEAGRDLLRLTHYLLLVSAWDATRAEALEDLFYEQREDFVKLAKRDLGVRRDSRAVRPVEDEDDGPSDDMPAEGPGPRQG